MACAQTTPEPLASRARGEQQQSHPHKQNSSPQKTHLIVVMVDEAKANDACLLFVWQFSKILIQVSN